MWSASIPAPAFITDISALYPFVTTSDDSLHIRQFSILNGMEFGNMTTMYVFTNIAIQYDSSTQTYKCLMYDNNINITTYSTITDTYLTANGSCIAGYTNVSGTCTPTVPKSILTFINFTAPAPVPAPAPAPAPSPSPQANSFDVCFEPRTQDITQCTIFCSERCEECGSARLECGSCSQYYYKLGESQSFCEMDTFMSKFSLTYAIANAYKFTKSLAFYAYLQNFQLYEYHRIRYRGILEKVFNFTRFISEKQWELIQLNQVQNKFDEFWFVGSEYLSFTNIDYLSI